MVCSTALLTVRPEASPSVLCLHTFNTEQLSWKRGRTTSSPDHSQQSCSEAIPMEDIPQPSPGSPPHVLTTVIMFILFILLISNLNFLPLLLICLLTVNLENKLYLLQQIMLFSKITTRNNVDTIPSGWIPISLSGRVEILLLIPCTTAVQVFFFPAVHHKRSWLGQRSHVSSTDKLLTISHKALGAVLIPALIGPPQASPSSL